MTENRGSDVSREDATGSSSTGRGPGPLTFGSRGLTALLAAILLIVVIATAVLALNDDEKDQGVAAGQGPSTSAATASSAPAAADRCRQPTGVPAAQGKPTDIAVPDKPVTRLRVRDLREGSGAEAVDGSQLTVQYVGISCTSGRQFDASWDQGEPFRFTLGGQVIPGWNEGIKGMKVGGRRLLWIPASQAYGEQGSPPDIAANDTLIFVIDLLRVG